MNPYVQAMRVPFLAGSIVPVVIGAAYAFKEGSFSLTFFLIAVVGVGALHTGANLINDYYDARGSDPINVRITPFSGGSRVLPEERLSPGTVLIMTWFFFALALACAILATGLGRPLVLVIGGLGFLAGWCYSSSPFQLMSRGWGEIVIFLAFGPLVTMGSFYVMSGHLSGTAFLLGLPQGFLIMAVIWINQFPDYAADRDSGKRNLVVRLGPSSSRYVYCFIMCMAFVSVMILVGVGAASFLTMVTFVAFPLTWKAMRILWRDYLSYDRVIPAQALTIQTVVAHGVLLSLGIAASRLFGI
jgi:1,4-dihydroxy-2-naphthoate octaprenyltransferase